MNAPAATDRSTIDALLVELLACLRGAELHWIADAVAASATDAARAVVIHEHSDRVPVSGRQIYLRMAMPWVARAIESWAAGDYAEALRWRDRAASELERFRDEPRGETT